MRATAWLLPGAAGLSGPLSCLTEARFGIIFGAVTVYVGLRAGLFPGPAPFGLTVDGQSVTDHTVTIRHRDTLEQERIVLQPYYDDGSGKEPRYYQRNAINATVEVIAKGQDRVLLVMATGTGKTYTAFQIIWRLWKSGAKKRILFLADRNILIDQTMVNDFRPFGGAMAKLSTKSKTIERADGTVQEPARVTVVQSSRRTLIAIVRPIRRMAADSWMWPCRLRSGCVVSSAPGVR